MVNKKKIINRFTKVNRLLRCLRNDAKSALAIAAAANLDFIRVNVHTGAYLTDQGLIEGEAAYHALEQLVDDDVNQLRELNQEMRQATDEQNINQFMQLNREFHMTIYRRVGSTHYLDSITRLWERKNRMVDC